MIEEDGISCVPAVVGIAFEQPLAFQATPDALSDGVRQLGQLSTRRRLHPAKPHARPRGTIDVDTVEKAHVEVDVCIERAAEALDQRHRAAVAQLASTAGFFDEVRGNAAVNDAEHCNRSRARRLQGDSKSWKVSRGGLGTLSPRDTFEGRNDS